MLELFTKERDVCDLEEDVCFDFLWYTGAVVGYMLDEVG